MTRHLKRPALYDVVFVLVLVSLGAAIALAAPTSGPWNAKLRSDSGYGEGSGYFRVGDAIRPVKGQTYIFAPSNFKCNSANLALVKKSIPRNGDKFSYTKGAYPDFARAPQHVGQLTWKGTFTSAGKVKGTIRFESPVTPKPQPSSGTVKFVKKPCDTGTLNWNGTPRPGG